MELSRGPSVYQPNGKPLSHTSPQGDGVSAGQVYSSDGWQKRGWGGEERDLSERDQVGGVSSENWERKK